MTLKLPEPLATQERNGLTPAYMYEAIVRDCVKVCAAVAKDIGTHNTISASVAHECEENIRFRYGLEPEQNAAPLTVEETQQLLGAESPIPVANIAEAEQLYRQRKNVKTDIFSLVDRFLQWPMPFSVCADLCATKQQNGRVGTNLLSAEEARQMLEYVLQLHPDAAPNAQGTDQERAEFVAGITRHMRVQELEPAAPSRREW